MVFLQKIVLWEVKEMERYPYGFASGFGKYTLVILAMAFLAFVCASHMVDQDKDSQNLNVDINDVKVDVDKNNGPLENRIYVTPTCDNLPTTTVTVEGYV